MSKFKSKSVDKNRMVKKYPFVRAPKRTTLQGDGDITMELGSVSFVDAVEKTFLFEESFSDDRYSIMLVTRDVGTGESANVNVYIDNTRSDKSKVVIVASAAFTGIVDLVAVRVQ